MRRGPVLIFTATLLFGCTNFNNDSVAGGGCDRKTTYGIEFDLLGFSMRFGLAARCETGEPDDNA